MGFLERVGLASKSNITRLEEEVATLIEGVGDTSSFEVPFDQPYARQEYQGLPHPRMTRNEWTMQARDKVLDSTHMAWERNPIAGAAVKFTTQFTVGKGMRLAYKNRAVRDIIQRFMDNPDNDFEAVEKESMNALQKDGELFVRFVNVNEVGDLAITFIPPWAVRDIFTHPVIKRHHMFYDVQKEWYPTDHLDVLVKNKATVHVAADNFLYIATNRAPYEVRGRPDLFLILPWLRAYKDWLENRARINRLKTAILLTVQLAGATAAQVNAKKNVYKKPPPPGSVIVSSDKEEWEIKSAKVDAGNVKDDGRAMKVMAATGVQLPEYFLSDGTSANLATARAQQLPVLRKFADYQDIAANQLWKPIFRRVIEAAIEVGRLTEMVQIQDSEGEEMSFPTKNGDGTKGRMIKAVDAFEILYPELESDDPKNLADALEIAQDLGWVSPETASAKMGYDYQEEQRRVDQAKAMAKSKGQEEDSIYGPGNRDKGADSGPSGQRRGPGATVNE